MAAARTLLNTAKVMADNAVALAGAAATVNLDHQEKEPRFQRLEPT